MAGGKYLLGHLGTDLKGQAKFDLLCWLDQICLNLGFVAGLECIGSDRYVQKIQGNGLKFLT